MKDPERIKYLEDRVEELESKLKTARDSARYHSEQSWHHEQALRDLRGKARELLLAVGVEVKND